MKKAGMGGMGMAPQMGGMVRCRMPCEPLTEKATD